ncbi:MAG TPA: nucleoside recognition domain-containing protein [Candidatus Angelobacter sp.]|nr:nucleoside recognition domain-containing protein [Candidatus Angelobacter sp.]
MAKGATARQTSPVSNPATVVVVGKESSGKSQLISSLTGGHAYSSNFRGTTVSCEIFSSEEHEFIDTPGILLQSDSITTSLALQQLKQTDIVLVVLKATQLAEDIKELFPLLKGKRAVGVVTFWDKVSQGDKAEQALKDLSERFGIPLVAVDARHLREQDRNAVTQSLHSAMPVRSQDVDVSVPWVVQPKKTPLESKYLGAILGLALLLVPAVLAVYCANHFADWLDPSIESLSQKLVAWMAGVSSPFKEILVGRYGLLTMGPLLFVWAVPTVLLYAFVVGIYKASGLLDRITVALHPAMRRLGMTGRDLVRVVMGYGCNVPAVINTRCCSSATRDTTISAIAFGSACSYQFGATLAVFGAVSKPFLVVPYLGYLVLTTIIYARIVAGKTPKSPFLILSMDKPTFLEAPRPKAIWAEARVTIIHFFRRAMPIFLGITVVASVLDWLGVINLISKWVSPVMTAFNLPAQAAVAVVFSSIRKDAILLFTNDAGFAHLRNGQILTAVYLAGVLLPCLVTALTIAREKSTMFALKLMTVQAGAAVAFSLLLAWGTAALKL